MTKKWTNENRYMLRQIVWLFSILSIIDLFSFTPATASDDPQQIREWANAGDSEAQFRLGGAYDFANFGIKQNYFEAVKWYRQSAEQGHTEAEYSLGNLYKAGLGVDTDYSIAFSWFKRAADQGHPDAFNDLALLYEYGQGVEQDQSKANALYKQAADRGSLAAMLNLGTSYALGQGIEKNYIEAYKWLYLLSFYTPISNDMNLKWGARQKLRELKEWMTNEQIEEGKRLSKEWDAKYGMEQDPRLGHTISKYKQAAEEGDVRCILNLGISYHRGLGVEKDYIEAFKWLDIARFKTQGVHQRDGDDAFRLKWQARGEFDVLERLMTRKQIKEGERIAKEWSAGHKKTNFYITPEYR